MKLFLNKPNSSTSGIFIQVPTGAAQLRDKLQQGYAINKGLSTAEALQWLDKWLLQQGDLRPLQAGVLMLHQVTIPEIESKEIADKILQFAEGLGVKGMSNLVKKKISHYAPQLNQQPLTEVQLAPNVKEQVNVGRVAVVNPAPVVTVKATSSFSSVKLATDYLSGIDRGTIVAAIVGEARKGVLNHAYKLLNI